MNLAVKHSTGMLAEILDVYRWEAEAFNKAAMGLQWKIVLLNIHKTAL